MALSETLSKGNDRAFFLNKNFREMLFFSQLKNEVTEIL